jgi:alkanesulfonate monooxygenase SsuD/methylene tetrahydromethanopterin reductase-like flavin-dependent oxidoreductase (luciferase family)
MKVGVLQFFSWPERRVPLETVYERALQRIDVMEQTGYEAVWLAEHHFTSFSVCPSVHLMGMLVAARTKRLRIGTAVTLAAMYHPLRIAEEVALLDIFSGGRVNWGAGRGFEPTEFRAFGIPVEESQARFRENVEIVLEAWRSDRLTFKGEHYDFENIEVLPKPQQKPTPPYWVAATSPPAIRWAAERGHPILMDPHSAHRDIAAKRDFYRQELEAHGESIEGRTIPMARLLAIGETHAEAEDVARRGAQWTVGAYVNPEHQSGKNLQAFGPPSGEGVGAVDPVQRYLDGVIIYGTPEEVTDEIRRLQVEMHLEYLMCAPLSHKTFELFTDRVLPKVAVGS